MIITFLLVGIVIGLFAGLIAFLITYEEYCHFTTVFCRNCKTMVSFFSCKTMLPIPSKGRKDAFH